MSKIMIVNDNKDIVETLKTLMEIQGHKTEISYNGKEFLSKVESFGPDLILLDVMMPGMTTKEILTSLNDNNFDMIKIIMVSVVRFSEDEKNMLMKTYNIKDYITKPFDVPDILNRVKNVLQ